MADICEAAERKAQELGRYVSPQTRARLSTYDEETQVAWIVNPMMEWMLQRIQNEIMAGRNSQPTTTTPNPTKPLVDTKKPVNSKKPVADDDDDTGFDLFAEPKSTTKKPETKKPVVEDNDDDFGPIGLFD